MTAAAPALNDRQRAYLLAIFEADQAVEADMRSIPFSPFHERTKASEWRWLEYSEPIPIIGKDASRLYAAIKKASKIDQGTGSTFDALAARGLVQVGVRGPDGYPHRVRALQGDLDARIPVPNLGFAKTIEGQEQRLRACWPIDRWRPAGCHADDFDQRRCA